MAIIDVTTFNGEYEILELRLNILNDFVDQFIIVEASTTFSGKPKPLYYERDKERFKKFHHKIKYFIISEDYTSDEIRQAKKSSNTQGASHWKREFLQKESIKKALTHLHDDDICFIGDVDEIWEKVRFDLPLKLKLRVYTYHLNNRSNEIFWGGIMARYGTIKDGCLNHLRTTIRESSNYLGWHFTSMGGYKELDRKLSDSYTSESYYTPWVKANLHINIEDNIDFLNRDFKFYKDESEWPQYLKDNRKKYERLLR